MTQCERLLDWLQKQPITPMEAWNRLGIYRLAPRIFELKEAGHAIVKETVPVMNHFGETCQVARYSLGKGS